MVYSIKTFKNKQNRQFQKGGENRGSYSGIRVGGLEVETRGAWWAVMSRCGPLSEGDVGLSERFAQPRVWGLRREYLSWGCPLNAKRGVVHYQSRLLVQR